MLDVFKLLFYIARMRSQSQLRNDKYIMMEYTNWINSTPRGGGGGGLKG